MKFNSLLVAHDAGGANALQSIICSKSYYHAYATGPSKKILSHLPNVSIVNDFELIEYGEIIIATSWRNKKWLKVLCTCLENDLNHFVIMDHWSNYVERFYYNKKMIVPEHLITLDKYATEITQKEFPSAKVTERINVHLERQKQIIAEKRKSIPQTNLLFIGEYTDIFIPEEGIFYEQKLFASLCKHLAQGHSDLNLCLRPHPSENKNKYNSSKALFPFTISERSLEDDFASAELVVGHDSHALYLAVECGIRCKRAKFKQYPMDYTLPISLPDLFLE